jgi:hypothetical protein
MEPALRPGDWLIVWRGFGSKGPEGAARPARRARLLGIGPGVVVVARHPQDQHLLLVKRAAWAESGGWWLSSDNPNAGAVDSTRFGPVPLELIEGRVLGRYWPKR